MTALRTTMTFGYIPLETRAKLVVLRSALHKTFAKILEEMVDTLWEVHKDEVTTSVPSRKVQDVFASAMMVTEQKAPYNTEGRRAKRKNAQGQDNINLGIRKEVRPVPVPEDSIE